MVAPSAAAGEAAAAASAAAAAGAPAEQLQGYQAAAAEAQHQQQFAATALSAGGTPTAAEAEAAAAAMAAAATALPAHMPAAAAPAAAAAAAPQRELPRGDIVLVGGHDSGSWLDSVGEWSRTLGVSSARCLQCCWWAVVRAAAALGQPRLLLQAEPQGARSAILQHPTCPSPQPPSPCALSRLRADCFSPHDRVWASLPLLGKPRSFSAAVGTGALACLSQQATRHELGMEWRQASSCSWAVAPPVATVPAARILPSCIKKLPSLQGSLPSTRLYRCPPLLPCPAANEVFVAGGGDGIEW